MPCPVYHKTNSDEKDLVDCVQRFFSKHHVGKLLARCNGMKEQRCFYLFLCFVTNSATFLSEEVCICSSRLGLLKKSFPRTLFNGSLLLAEILNF